MKINIQFTKDIWQRREVDGKTELILLFRKGHHARAEAIAAMEKVFEERMQCHLSDERCLELCGIIEPSYMIQNHFTKEWSDLYPNGIEDVRKYFSVPYNHLVMSRITFSSNLIVRDGKEIVYMPNITEYVIPSDKWHRDENKWVGEWTFNR